MSTFPFMDGQSDFSIGESLISPSDLIAAATGKSNVVTLCDRMGLWGVPAFSKAAFKAGLKPIVGVRLAVFPTLDRVKAKKNKPFVMRAIVLDDSGWFALMELLSVAFDEEHFFEVPRLLLGDVTRMLAGKGVALSLGTAYGAIPAGSAGEVARVCASASVPLYCDIPLATTPFDIRLAMEALKLSDELGLECLLCPVMRYVDAEDADALDLMAAVARNMPISDNSNKHPFRPSIVPDAGRVASLIREMASLMSDRYTDLDGKWALSGLARAVRSTGKFPDLVTFKWEKLPPALPTLAEDPDLALMEMCKIGFRSRLMRKVFGFQPDDLRPYMERLSYELGVLKKLGFAPYFLLVNEIVSEARSRGILVGPGRGSVGGSLVAFLIGMTDVDPLRFGLMFERFINPDRLDLPDADLDFMSTRRQELVDWVSERFGADKVAGVSNHTTIGAAGALLDSCRMLKVENYPAFSKMIPKDAGVSASIEESLEFSPELAKFATENPTVVGLARRIEGRMRSFGKHAAGIVVSDEPISQRAVVERRGGDAVVCWDKWMVEDFGLVKIDILGLSTLDMLDVCARKVREMSGRRIDWYDVPLDDEKVLASFAEGQTVGVFQFEGGGMRRLLKDLGSKNDLSFSDLVAAVALYRPGPMKSGMMDRFVAIRQGTKEPDYPHESFRQSAEETNGVLVYQEQVMALSRNLCGFTGAEADNLRKIMGKKLPEEMEKLRSKFVDGAVAGYVEVELDDGTTRKIHRNAKIAVVEAGHDPMTIEQIFELGLTPKLL